jgi:ADP-heptose:LPS heptosyltransferase
LPVFITGTKAESRLCDEIAALAGNEVYSIAGIFSIDEFIAFIAGSSLVLSVNTGTVHIAAALEKPVIVLYADTNPQHTPWKVPSEVFVFPVKKEERSKNEVIRFLYKNRYEPVRMPDHDDIIQSARTLIQPRPILR